MKYFAKKKKFILNDNNCKKFICIECRTTQKHKDHLILHLNMENFEENIEVLSSQGFQIESFGKNCFKVTTIPMMLSGINLNDYFTSVLSGLNDMLKKPQDIIRRHFATMACKAAVKGGNELSDNEINTLLNLMKENHNTLLCPHGRPIIVTFDKKQIEKMFKRIV